MLFFQDYLRDKFSHRVYRVPVDLGFSCPGADSKESRCYFCDESGSRAQHLQKDMPLERQLQRGVSFVREKYGENCGLALYVQANCGTNAPVASFKTKIDYILSLLQFDCIIVATRPDLISDEYVNYFSEISKKTEFWLEIGVQTANDRTLEVVNRRHNFACVVDAVKRLNEANINCAAHIILGLPGEEICDFRRTAKEISSLPFRAIKVHHLQILKNTVFEDWYREGKIRTLNEYEYADILMDFLSLLPQNWLLMRICADYDEKIVIAPKWQMSKAQFLEMIRIRLAGGDISKFSKVRSADGSWTLWHPSYREHYRSIEGAKTESKLKFVDACEIRKKFELKKHLKILEIGFGIAYNLAETVKTFRDSGEEVSLEYIALEKNMQGIEAAIVLGLCESYMGEILRKLLTEKMYTDRNLRIVVIEGDARSSIRNLQGKFDAVYLDPFSPDKNPELWTYDFLRVVSEKMTSDAILATYSSSFSVRGALYRCGFHLGDGPALGRKRGGTIASLDSNQIKTPIKQKELDVITKTITGVAYRDPILQDLPSKIIERRKKLCERLSKRSVPKWLH